MARVAREAVRVDGLAALRRDLRAMRPDALREVRVVLKAGAKRVADRAVPYAPRRTGALRESIKAGTAGDSAFVRSTLPYAEAHEWGATIAPRGTEFRIQRSRFIGRAVRDESDKVLEEVGAGLERVAMRHGWR